MYSVINAEGGGENFDEALGLVSSPSRLCFAVFSELGFGEVVDGIHAYCLVTERTKFEDGGSGDVAL